MIPTTLQRYVLCEALRVALLSVVALTAIIFVGAGLELARRGVSVVQLWGVIPYIVAFSLPYAVPCALLVATVFVFGRMSGSNEVTAIQVAGINLNHIIYPLLIVAALVCGGAFWLNHYVLPWSLSRKNEMAKQLVGRAIASIGSVQKVFPLDPYVIYVGRAEEKARFWRNVAVIEFADDEFPSSIMIAKQAHCAVDEQNDLVKLLLFDVMVIRPRLSGDLEGRQVRTTLQRVSQTIDLGKGRRPSDRPKYAQLPELVARIGELEASAAEIRRTYDDPAALVHPRQARKAAEKRMDEAYRDMGKVKDKVADCRKAFEKTETALREVQDAVLAAKGGVGAAQQDRDDIASKIAERAPALEAIESDLEALIESGAEPERVADRREELRTEREAVEGLRLALGEAEAALEKEKAELAEVETALNARRAEAEAAGGELAAAEERAKESQKLFLAEKKRVNAVKEIESLLRAKTAFHERNASALTTLIFVMIGIPLGILSRRGSVLMAFVVSFFAVLVLYYPLMMIAELLSLDGYAPPWLAQWTPNVAVGGIGARLLVRGIRR